MVGPALMGVLLLGGAALASDGSEPQVAAGAAARPGETAGAAAAPAGPAQPGTAGTTTRPAAPAGSGAAESTTRPASAAEGGPAAIVAEPTDAAGLPWKRAGASPSALERSGLYGWGLGLELPLVGVLTGFGSGVRTGSGYTVGGALSWEVTPSILVRLHVIYDQTYRGRARLDYVSSVQSNTRTESSQLEANWLGLAVGLGGAYLVRAPDRPWTPYIGADAALRVAGFDYLFDESLQPLESTGELTDAERYACTSEVCSHVWHDGLGVGWMATLRGGIRLDLASWLQSQIDLSLSYTRTTSERIANTTVRRDVRAAVDDVYLVRTTFSVRLGL